MGCLPSAIWEITFVIVRQIVMFIVQFRPQIIKLEELSDIIKDRFIPREMEIWPQMEHDNIIRMDSVVEHYGYLFFFMELATRGSVIDLLAK